MSEPLRLLLVEDSETDAKLVLRAIRAAGHAVAVERVQTAEAMRAALEERQWDLVISDWSMPAFSAPDALAVLKEKELDLPFIIVSGTVGEEAAVEAMRAGAHDYVIKDRLARLAPAIERELRERKMRDERRCALNDLRLSESRFSRLFESGIIATVMGNQTGSIVEANDAFLRIVGYSRDDLEQGRIRWRDLTAPEWQEATNRGIEELRTRGVAAPYEKEYIRKDGSRVPVLIGIATLTEGSSIAFIVDLTAQKRAEETLRKTEEQLRQAQKMEAVGRLAGGVAHDFNNILTVILSYSSIIAGELDSADPMLADIEEIGEAGRRAADLTRQLLTFSRQEVVETKVLDLSAVVTNLQKLLHRVIGEDIELTFTPARAHGMVRADPSHLEQVVMNLTVNARDAMPRGGKLTIETADVVLDASYARDHHGVTPGAYVMLAVTDTGCGMTAEVQQRIFEPFFTTKEKGKGTGLGLSTVFGIVQQSAGTIWVYSEPGKGTVFKVYFPRVDAPADVALHTIAPRSARGSETILLVEDDDRVRAVALGILRRQGYRVIEARNAGEALLTCERHPEDIHLLLTDVVMPQMSGPELAKRVTLGYPHIKILCMSGYTDDAVVRHGALEAGIAFLQKPFTPKTLADKVRSVLDAEGGAGPVSRRGGGY